MAPKMDYNSQKNFSLPDKDYVGSLLMGVGIGFMLACAFWIPQPTPISVPITAFAFVTVGMIIRAWGKRKLANSV
jgi:hypothetical protein